MNKILIWAGAGISEGYPANLPNTREVALYMVEKLCGESAMPVFRDRIDQYNAFMCELNHNTSSLAYPDILISQWGRIKAVHVNTAITSFLYAPYNLKHYCMAMLLSKGANIVTPNMDLCIECAYEAFMQGVDRFERSELENGVAIYTGQNRECGAVYHIHGTAEDISSVGGVVEIGKPYFSKTFRDKLIEWMQEDYEVYVCGYDCRDVYDVKMLFHYLKRHVPQIRWSATVVDFAKKQELPVHLRKINMCFKKVKLLPVPISDICLFLYAEKTGEAVRELRRKACQMVRSQSVVGQDWKQAVDAALPDLEEYKDILLLYINQTLGVPVAEMDAEIFRRLEDMPESYKNMYTSLMLRYSRDLIPVYGYATREGSLVSQPSSGQQGIKSDESNYLQVPGYGEELFRLCQDEYNTMNKQIAMATKFVDKMQQDYLSALRCKTRTVKWENEAEELLEDIQEMLPREQDGRLLEIPKNNYRDFADLYRLRAAVKAICYNDETKIDSIKLDLEYSYMYCSQSANWNGVLKTLSYASFCYLSFYYKYGKKSFYDKAQHYKTMRKKQELEKNLRNQ